MIVGYSQIRAAQPYQLYTIVVARLSHLDGLPNVWTIFRRYSDFRSLHLTLQKKGIAVPAKFPGKMIQLFASADAIRGRMEELKVREVCVFVLEARIAGD